MSDNYEDKPLFELKEACEEKGINAKGTKSELIDKLNESMKIAEHEKSNAPAPNEEALKRAEVIEKLHKFKPNISFVQATDEAIYEAWLTNQRLEQLGNMLRTQMAGKASFTFNKKDRQVEFSGGIRGLWSTTLIDTDNQILGVARQYTSRAARGSSGQKSYI